DDVPTEILHDAPWFAAVQIPPRVEPEPPAPAAEAESVESAAIPERAEIATPPAAAAAETLPPAAADPPPPVRPDGDVVDRWISAEARAERMHAEVER